MPGHSLGSAAFFASEAVLKCGFVYSVPLPLKKRKRTDLQIDESRGCVIKKRSRVFGFELDVTVT